MEALAPIGGRRYVTFKMSLETLFNKNKISILSFLFFTILHPIAVIMTVALLAGWHDVEIFGGILGALLIILMPLLLLGQKVAFFGVGVYFVSALLWGLLLSLITTFLYGLYKKINKNGDITRPRKGSPGHSGFEKPRRTNINHL